jgi:hypothetical protein
MQKQGYEQHCHKNPHERIPHDKFEFPGIVSIFEELALILNNAKHIAYLEEHFPIIQKISLFQPFIFRFVAFHYICSFLIA